MGRITFVIGTKAEFLRLFPLMLYLQKKNEPYDLVHTWQHDLEDYPWRFQVKPAGFYEFPEFKDTEVNIKSLYRAYGLYHKLQKTLKELKPSMVIYQGDTLTTGIASLVCKRSGFRSAHVEAGFRSGNWKEPFPEETIRKVADRRASILFASSESAWMNLNQEKVKGDIILSGSTVTDSVRHVMELPNRRAPLERAVITMHRYENLFNVDRLRKIIDILQFATIPLIWPMHEHTRQKLQDYGMMEDLRGISILPSLDYRDFIGLVAGSSYTITDGGSLEEESVVLGRKCLLLRKLTERTELQTLRLTFLGGLNVSKSANYLREIEESPTCDSSLNPYYLGRPASEIIGDRLLEG